MARMVGRLALAAVMFVAAGAISIRSSAAAEVGIIEGTVTNGTSESPVARVEVVLTVTDGARVATTTDAGGRFRFVGLDAAGRSYSPRILFRDVDYAWDSVTLEPGRTTVSLTLRVFDPTRDPSQVTLKTASFIVLDLDRNRQVLQLLQFMTFENRGKEAFIGPPTDGRPEVIRLRPPDGTLRVDTLGGSADEIIQTPDSVAISRPLVPGLTDIVLGYEIAYAGAEKTLRLDFGIVPQEAFILVPEGSLDVSGDRVAFDKFVELEGLRVARSTVTPGDTTTIEARLSGLPQADRDASRDSTAGRVAAIVAAAAGLAAVGAYVVRRPRSLVAAPLGEAALSARDAIFRRLLDLDDERERGDLDDATYASRRSELVARLRKAR